MNSIYYCKKCNKQISKYSAIYGSHLCLKCSRAKKKGVKRPEHSKSMQGKRNSRYIDGRKSKTYYCSTLNCNNIICYTTYMIGNKKCRVCSKIGRKHSIETKRKMSLTSGGTGISRENSEYGAEFDNSLKEQVRFRDNYKCKECGCSQVENGRQLDVHHIDYNKKNNNMNNLIALCISCHGKIRINREYWIKYFKKREYEKFYINCTY